jgi:hypothetical protein
MTPKSATAADVAHRLWLQTAGDVGEPEAAAEAAERLCAQLAAGLSHWIGVEGYRALFDRAVGLVRSEHPALGSLTCVHRDGPVAAAARGAPGAADVAAGMAAVMTALIELLGRIIGDEMAVHLVEQIGIPSVRGGVSAKTEGGRDG